MNAPVLLPPAASKPQRVLVVDDEPDVRLLLEEQLGMLGFDVATATSAEGALAFMDVVHPDLVITDVYMGAMSGVDLCARLKADSRFQLTPVIILTGIADIRSRVAGLAAGADDFFAKPYDLRELQTRVTSLLRTKALVDELERAEGLLTMLALTIEARDPYTAGHCERLSRYAVAAGRALRLDETHVRALQLGGYLHDLGKVAVPDAILLKPGPLDPEERACMEQHPVKGEELVSHLRSLDLVRPIIRHHHERMDGSGYPDGLDGQAIPLGARIMAVVDVYDALCSRRAYKQPLPVEQALTILRREAAAGYWDTRVVEAFISTM